MTINTGLNTSKLDGFAVLGVPQGLAVSKLAAYAVLQNPALLVTKLNAYAVLESPRLTVSKLNAYTVLDSPSATNGGFAGNGAFGAIGDPNSGWIS